MRIKIKKSLLTLTRSYPWTDKMVYILAANKYLYEHISMARFAVPAVALDLYSIGMLNSLRQIALALQIDYGRHIATIQKQIEALQVLRIRTIQWGLLAGFVAWVPFMIVVFKAAFGVDIYVVVSKVTSGMDIYELPGCGAMWR